LNSSLLLLSYSYYFHVRLRENITFVGLNIEASLIDSNDVVQDNNIVNSNKKDHDIIQGNFSGIDIINQTVESLKTNDNAHHHQHHHQHQQRPPEAAIALNLHVQLSASMR